MDAIAVTAIIAGCSALIVAVLTHIKHSSCTKQGFDITTTESHTPTLTNLPELVSNETSTETVQESRPPSPAILIIPSKPISIPTTPLLEKRNYL
jgi:hypothetical protein